MAASGNKDVTGQTLTPDDYTVLFGVRPTLELELPAEQATPTSERHVDVRSRSDVPDDARSSLGNERTSTLRFSTATAEPPLDIRSQGRRGQVPRSAISPPAEGKSRHNPFVWAAFAGGAACVVVVGLLITLAQDEEPIIVEAPEEVIFPIVLSETEVAEQPVTAPDVTSPG